MIARTANATERTDLWPMLINAYSDFDNYQAWTAREIPVVICDPAWTRAMSADPIWTPTPARDHVEAASPTSRGSLPDAPARHFGDFRALLAWSVGDLDTFWRTVWEYFDVLADGGAQIALASREMPGATWFPGASLNYVEQVFRDRPPGGLAIIELDETGRHIELTWAELQARTAWLRGLDATRPSASHRATGSWPTCPTPPRQ